MTNVYIPKQSPYSAKASAFAARVSAFGALILNFTIQVFQNGDFMATQDNRELIFNRT